METPLIRQKKKFQGWGRLLFLGLLFLGVLCFAYGAMEDDFDEVEVGPPSKVQLPITPRVQSASPKVQGASPAASPKVQAAPSPQAQATSPKSQASPKAEGTPKSPAAQTQKTQGASSSGGSCNVLVVVDNNNGYKEQQPKDEDQLCDRFKTKGFDESFVTRTTQLVQKFLDADGTFVVFTKDLVPATARDADKQCFGPKAPISGTLAGTLEQLVVQNKQKSLLLAKSTDDWFADVCFNPSDCPYDTLQADNKQRKTLAVQLTERGYKRENCMLHVVGIVQNRCVMKGALHARSLGWEVTLYRDLILPAPCEAWFVYDENNKVSDGCTGAEIESAPNAAKPTANPPKPVYYKEGGDFKVKTQDGYDWNVQPTPKAMAPCLGGKSATATKACKDMLNKVYFGFKRAAPEPMTWEYLTTAGAKLEDKFTSFDQRAGKN